MNPDHLQPGFTNEDKREAIHGLKSVPCADCGQSYPFYVMDFDHRPGEEKLFELSQAGTKAMDRILAEAAKCDVVCANCHRVRTWERKDFLRAPRGE